MPRSVCNSTRILGSRYACKIFHVNRCRGEKAAARYKRNNINEGEEAEVGGPQHPPDSVAEGRRGRKGYEVLTELKVINSRFYNWNERRLRL